MEHFYYLDIACQEATLAQRISERPAGALLLKNPDKEIVSQSHEQCQTLNDPVATAEMDCIRRAGRRSDQADLTLYTTRYPDMLCAGTLLQFSIGALVVGLPETDSRALALLSQKQLPVTFVPHQGCMQLMREETRE